MTSTSIDQLIEQARTACRAGDLETAISLYQSAAAVESASSAIFMELADALWGSFDFEGALRALEESIRRDPSNPVPAMLCGKRLFGLGRFPECARILAAALELCPADVTLRRMLAEVRDREGNLVEAEAMARESLAENPHDALTVRALAHTLRRANRIDEARELLSRQLRDEVTQDDWRLQYELAACLDRGAEYAGAMEALQQAKAQLRPIAAPLVERWRARAKRREEFACALDRGVLERWRASAPDNPVPLAVLAGHPRSGTTLLEQMLSAHSGVVTTDESGVLRQQFIEPIVMDAASTEDALREVNGFDTDQLAVGRSFYFRATQAHIGQPSGNRLLVEKDPLATQDLGFILRLLPESRVIFPLRDPRDVCVSFFFTLVPLNADSAPSLDLSETCASAALSLRLWRHWRRILPQDWREVRYESLVRDPAAELRPLLNMLGLAWESSTLAPASRQARGVRSPTYADVGQPLHARAIGRWQNYAAWLEPHLGPLREMIEEFGYA